MTIKTKIQAFLLAIIIQCALGAILFLAGLLDPLLLVWALGIYFIIIGGYTMYRSLLSFLSKQVFD